MGKNWLIRTKSNHILGPVSKEKVLELYQNGSIKPDDEICSGNGYWFFIRESDLINKYLLGAVPQSFNPISEAKDVLTDTKTEQKEGHSAEAQVDLTMVGQINLSKLNEESENHPVDSKDSGQNSENNEIETFNKNVSDQLESSEENQKKKNKKLTTKTPAKTFKKHSYLKYSGLVIFIILFLILYFRKTILKTLMGHQAWIPNAEILLIDTAHAEEQSPQKKNF